MEAAEREAKAAQEKLAAARERLARMNAAPVSTPSIPQPVFEPPKENCFTKCFGAKPPDRKLEQKHMQGQLMNDLKTAVVKAGQTVQHELDMAKLEQMKMRGEVEDTRHRVKMAVQRQKTGLQSEEASAARTEMWSLLLKQIASGMGAPKEDQLELLWQKYDTNHDGSLQHNELVLIIKDYAASMHSMLTTQDLPKMKAAIAKQPDNFILQMQLKSLEQQEILFRAQKVGNIDAAAATKIFTALDQNNDGRVMRSEFIQRAPQVFYGAQIMAMGLAEGLQNATEQMPAECKQQ